VPGGFAADAYRGVGHGVKIGQLAFVFTRLLPPFRRIALFLGENVPEPGIDRPAVETNLTVVRDEQAAPQALPASIFYLPGAMEFILVIGCGKAQMQAIPA